MCSGWLCGGSVSVGEFGAGFESECLVGGFVVGVGPFGGFWE